MRKGEDTRAAILAAAVGLAGTVGLGGITIGTLAERTRLSKSGLYAHFQSKEDLQLRVLEHAKRALVAEVIAPALGAPRGEPRVRALFGAWLRWGSSPGGCLFTAAATELDDQPGPVRERLARDQRDWLETIAEVFRTGVTEGHFGPSADPLQFAFDLAGVLLSFHLATRLLDDPAAERHAMRAFERLLEDARPG